ncbi:DUF3575 domain-containing protein [Bacteroides thetaiotaomicron]|uniref:DUF3575 domain-containing protein n=1 Tax=Bacteroides thetaiotaomicron TaxID=818 RepID=UPI0023303837|nr:DUF3575 domain-containing protein [Bacteroides thetaiotaomicron]MDC2006829.1 DUF3575 domain-containing protein [Bacteroides thetaiotaomicron]MDC2020670.1 DUF3575 domain-containing protein [Bacteroides thetaiotaomicron]MDC2024572.1 DUF3575 domain-containing protein [Bacteroides thetaiotaomicron]MDC2029630.1 DUF3575 domain-containing protein [Bacteroides thetaiotaomicron]MDC2060090.1 DUF3575 domain-containing protein [Bacteroides thetaiotaomicron]
MNAWKTVLLCTLLAMVAAPMFAQATDKAPQVVFRFVEGNDMFYVPWNGNGTALDSLCRMIKPETLDKGSVKVDGYSDTKKLSMIRCNRVKSELITRKGLQEEHFTTTNNVGEWNGLKNVVFVTLPILYKVETEKRQETQRQDKSALTDSQKQSETAATSQEETTPVNETRQIAETTSSRTDNTDYGTLSLRANLLRWATLTPDLGIGWRINRNWSVQVNGTWTSWSWDGKNRRYALWEVSPEIRYYPGKMKRGYLGVMYHAGEFNYKLGDTGKQGDLMGGGLTGGYLLKLNRTLSLDFSLGIGCTYAEYEKYTVIDGVRVKQDKTDKNYWGVNRLGIGLVWNIF